MNTETKESNQPRETTETIPIIDDNKSIVSSKEITNIKIITEFPKGKVADKNKDKDNINVTKVVKNEKNNALKGIIDLASLNKLLDNKKTKTSNIKAKKNLSSSNNKANFSVDSSSLNISKISNSNNKGTERPNSLKGTNNNISKIKDIISKPIISKITGKNSTSTKDKNSKVLATNNNKQQPTETNKNEKKLIKSNKDLKNIKTNENDKINYKKEEISQQIDKVVVNMEESKLLKSENDNQCQESSLDKDINNDKNIKKENSKGIISDEMAFNRTTKNTFENLSELKKTVTERNLSSIDHNQNKTIDSKEINKEINREDLEKIKILEEKRKKLYSKLGYDVIDTQDATSKSGKFRQRKSDLDVFQNVNIKKIAKILELRFKGLEPEDDIDEKLIQKSVLKPDITKLETSDFIKVNTNKEKKKPTQKRFSLV